MGRGVGKERECWDVTFRWGLARWSSEGPWQEKECHAQGKPLQTRETHHRWQRTSPAPKRPSWFYNTAYLICHICKVAVLKQPSNYPVGKLVRSGMPFDLLVKMPFRINGPGFHAQLWLWLLTLASCWCKPWEAPWAPKFWPPRDRPGSYPLPTRAVWQMRVLLLSLSKYIYLPLQ